MDPNRPGPGAGPVVPAPVRELVATHPQRLLAAAMVEAVVADAWWRWG